MQIGSVGRARGAGGGALFFLCLGLLIAGCGGPKPVAVVNGKVLTESEFGNLCASELLITQNTPMPTSAGQKVLSDWVRATLMEEEARARNLYPSQADVDARLDRIRRMREYLGMSIEQELRMEGRTMEAFRRELVDQMIVERLLLGDVQITDAELRKFWEQQKKSLIQPETLTISQITVETEKELKDTQDDLNTPAAQFELVAQSRSKDGFAQNGGRVPFPVTKEVPPGMGVDAKVVAEAFKLQPGEISKPIRVGATWVIVRLEEKKPRKEPKFEDFSEDLRIQMQQQKMRQRSSPPPFQARWMEITRNAKVEINRPEYENLAQQIQTGNASPAGGPLGEGVPPPPPPGG